MSLLTFDDSVQKDLVERLCQRGHDETYAKKIVKDVSSGRTTRKIVDEVYREMQVEYRLLRMLGLIKIHTF